MFTSSSHQRPNNLSVILFTLGGLISFGPLSIDLYLPALPQIARSFEVSIETIQYSLTSFFIGLSVGQLFYGPLMDRFGRKRPLYFGMCIYIVASLGCALANNAETLILMRFFQALGSCAGIVGSRSMVRDLFDKNDSARVFSILMLIMGVAPIVAPLMGSFLSVRYGWPFLFLVLASLSSICLFCVIFFLPETRGSNPTVELSKSLQVYARIFSNRKFLGFVISGSLASSGLFAYIADSPFVFMEVYGVQPHNFGWFFASNAIGLIITSQMNVLLLKRYRLEQILKVAFGVLFVSSLLMVTAAYYNMGLPFLVVPLFVFVSTLGITFPNTSAAALAQEETRVGSASALMGTLQYVCAAISSSMVSLLHDGTSLPMTATMATCGFLSFFFFSRLKVA